MSNPGTALAIGTVIMALLAVLFFPERGLFFRWQRARFLGERALIEDALKHIYLFEQEGNKATVESLSGVLKVTRERGTGICDRLEKLGLVAISGSHFHLTEDGRKYALRIIRAHRLWERYLAEETGFEPVEWHGRADLREHLLTDEDVDTLAAKLGNPLHDPHGDPIPTASGEIRSHDGIPLTSLPVNQTARIVHMEDEPKTVYAQLVAEGLEIGMDLHLTEFSPQRVRFWAGGEEHLLAPVVAANITVVPLDEKRAETQETGLPLTSLGLGETGEVLSISTKIRGAERRRLMDLGILPGTQITAEMRSPGGDPTAYRIRGALIALRSEQAGKIRIRKLAGRGENAAAPIDAEEGSKA